MIVLRLPLLLFRAYRVWVAGVAGYLLGNVLAADLVARAAQRSGRAGADVRGTGSGNPGAANVMGSMGRSAGVAVLAGDIVKGALAARAGRVIAGNGGAYAAGIGAVAGHCFPALANFRGGKGVTTSLGTTIVCFPVYIPVDVGLAAVSFAGSRHAGKATAIASAMFTGAALLWWKRRWPTAWGTKPTVGLPIYAAATSAMIAWKFFAPRREEANVALDGTTGTPGK